MKAVIEAFHFPSAFQETYKYAEITWDKMMHRLQYFPPEDMRAWMKSSIEYANSLLRNKNNTNIQKLSIVLLTIYHFYGNDFSPLEEYFQFILKAEENETAHISAYCIAKITLEGAETNPMFASFFLTKSIEMISNSGKKSTAIMGLHIAKEFATINPTFFVLNSGNILDNIWNLLLSANEETQTLATETYTKYLTTLIKTEAYNLPRRFNQIMTQCMTHIQEMKNNASPGVAVVITQLLILKPHFFVNSLHTIFNAVSSNFNTAKTPLKQQFILIRALLSAVDTPVFHVELFPNVFTNMINSLNQTELIKTICDAFSILCDNVPDPVFERVSIILQACIRIVQNREPVNIKAVLNLLKKLISVDASINITQAQNIWQIVGGIIFTPNFLDLFPLLQKCGSTFWEDHSATICEKILRALEVLSDYSLHALKLIPMLPSISEDATAKMIPNVKKYLFAKNDELRAAAPRALLHIMSPDDPIEFSKILKQLIAIAASDTSLPVRISIISSFGPVHYPFLAHDPFLKFLKNLANDNSSEVRSYCFRVLKNTRKFSPIGSDAILRNALINALYALQCSASSFERANATESLPALIEASSVLFPIYATTMIPIIIKQLQMRGTNNTVIGGEAETQLTINLIKTLQGILQVNQPTISPYLTQILPIFTTILKEYSNKKIKKLVIDALSLFVKKTESTANIYGIAPQLLNALLSIAAQSESKSLKVRALEFLGQAGAVSPQRIPSEQSGCSRADDTIQLRNGVSQNEYFGSLVFPKLMEMVNDKYLANVRTQSLSTAITTLSMMSTQSSEHLSLIIPIILNHIQNSTDVMRIESIKQLKSLTIVAKQQMYPHVENILQCIYSQWEASDLSYFIDVISSIVNGLGNDFLPFLYPLVSKIRRTISSSVVTNELLANSCLRLSATLSSFFPNLTHLFIPQICKILSSVFVPNNIKITGLRTLMFYITKSNPQPYAGSIFSAVNNLCIDQDQQVAENALKVLSTLIILIDKNITYYAHRIIDVLQNDEHAALEFEKIMIQMKENQKPQLRNQSLIFEETNSQGNGINISLANFNVKQFVSCFNDDKMYTPKHWENWYQNLVKTSIAASPCTTISCCFQLASVHKQLATYLFPAAFSSCWNELSQIEQVALSKKLSKSLMNPHIPEHLLHSMVSLMEQMERVGGVMQFPSEDFINICISSHSLTLALHHTQENFLQTNNESMLRKYAILIAEMPRTVDTHPLLKLMKKPISKEFLLRMKHWEDAFPLYQSRLGSNDMTKEEFSGYIICAKNLYKYQEIIDQSSEVLSSYKMTIASLSQIFSEAAFFTDSSLMPFYSSFECEPSLQNLSMKALSLIVSKKYDEANGAIQKMFESIATHFSLSFQSPYPVVYPLIVWCQYLYELSEIVATNGDIPKDIWKQRLANSEANAQVWFTLLLPRIAILPDDKLQFNKFLEIARQDKKYTMFSAFFKLFYPNFDPDTSLRDYIPGNIYLRYLNAVHGKEEVLEKLNKLIQNRDKEPIHFSQIMMYFDCMINDVLFNKENLFNLQGILKGVLNNRNPSIVQKWSFTNYYLFQLDKTKTNYAIEAMKGFTSAIQTQPMVNYSDICAMISIFFETITDQNVVELSLPLFNSISIQKMGEVIPQLFSFVYSRIPKAKEASQQMLVNIIHTSPHLLLLYLLVFNEIPTAGQNCTAPIINISAMENPTLYNETMAFRMLVKAGSQTIFEKWLSPNRELISSLLNDDRTNKSALDHLFYKLNEVHIKEIIKMLSTGQTQMINKTVQQIVTNCQGFVRRLEVVRLNDILETIPSFEDCQILVPGASASTCIQSINNELLVIPVRSRPRQMTLTGKDGIQYTYHIKSQENATFNLRATQLITLFKMIMKRNLSNSCSIPFSIYSVCPIAHNICLIQCSKDQSFFEQLISKYRERNGVEHLIENKDISTLTINRIDSLQPIQRMEALDNIEVHKDDLKNTIWQISSTSDEWFEKYIVFSSSLSLTSCLNALVWVGGRYPSNILINTKTGEIFHIDFSVVFGDGMKNIQFQDCVPFRLTPMLISALGIDGLNMQFIPTFKKLHNILKDTAYQILPAFSLYAEEPQKPFPLQKTQGEKKAIYENIKHVLTDKEESVDSYIDRLIKISTDRYNLSKEHSTWRPLW